MKTDPSLCIVCKGYRNLCGLSYCPLVKSFKANVQSLLNIQDDLTIHGSSPPSIIVGEKGYPRIRLYYGIPPGVFGDEARSYDSPLLWFMKKSLGDIIELRSKLVNVVIQASVTTPEKLYEKEIGLAAISVKPVDTEARLLRKPVARISFDSFVPPRGPSAPVKEVKVTGNPVLSRKLDRVIWDDVRARDAVWELYKNGVDLYTIIRAFTLGFLGRKGQKRLVPTRWGITAVDSLLTNTLLEKVKQMPLINDIRVHYIEYLYNRYLIILYPDKYNGLWIEVWHPKSLWNPSLKPSWLIVKESYSNKLSIVDGGYLAARTSVVEYLYSTGRQAGVVILREILPQYVFPVGNWQIRESVKHALKNKPILINPSASELRHMIESRMSVPAPVIDLVLRRVYREKHIVLDKWFQVI